MSAPPGCSACGARDASSYFRVERVAADGTATPVTMVCSLRCLLSWAMQYGQLQGAKLAFGAKQAVDRIRGLFKL